MTDPRMERIENAANFLKERLAGKKPQVGIVLGSGLGKLGEEIADPIVIPYAEIPDYPRSTAVGHKGNFIVGELGGKTVIAMQGRFHYYEGYQMDSVTISVRVVKLLGVESLFVSNAAGACNPDFRVGDLVVIKDHINTLPNPLIGPNLAEFGPRFPDMTCAYDSGLRKLAYELGEKLGIELKTGVYFAGTGPTYETPAEVRFYRTIGADLLGMSTVPEVIVARHCGLRVFGVSVVTNVCNTENVERNLNDADDVVAKADEAAGRMTVLFRNIIENL